MVRWCVGGGKGFTARPYFCLLAGMELGLEMVKPRDEEGNVLPIWVNEDVVLAYALYASSKSEVSDHTMDNTFLPQKHSYLQLSSHARDRFKAKSPKYNQLRAFIGGKHTDFFNNMDSPKGDNDRYHSSLVEPKVLAGNSQLTYDVLRSASGDC